MTDYKHWKNYPKRDDVCFVTTTIEEFQPLLSEPHNASAVLSALDFYRQKYGILIHAYVVMPEHIHLLLRLQGTVELPKLMGDLKRYTSKQMLQWCDEHNRRDLLSIFSDRGSVDGESFSLWQRSFRSVPLFKEQDALVKAEYIHNNPVRRKLAVVAEQWPYSSAAAYVGHETLIKVDLIKL